MNKVSLLFLVTWMFVTEVIERFMKLGVEFSNEQPILG